jgi:hypothetical protein
MGGKEQGLVLILGTSYHFGIWYSRDVQKALKQPPKKLALIRIEHGPKSLK